MIKRQPIKIEQFNTREIQTHWINTFYTFYTFLTSRWIKCECIISCCGRGGANLTRNCYNDSKFKSKIISTKFGKCIINISYNKKIVLIWKKAKHNVNSIQQEFIKLSKIQSIIANINTCCWCLFAYNSKAMISQLNFVLTLKMNYAL